MSNMRKCLVNKIYGCISVIRGGGGGGGEGVGVGTNRETAHKFDC